MFKMIISRSHVTEREFRGQTMSIFEYLKRYYKTEFAESDSFKQYVLFIFISISDPIRELWGWPLNVLFF